MVVKQSEHRYRWSLNSQNTTVAREARVLPSRGPSRASQNVGDAFPVITPAIARKTQASSFWNGAFASYEIVHRGATLRHAAPFPALHRVGFGSFVDQGATDMGVPVYQRDSL